MAPSLSVTKVGGAGCIPTPTCVLQLGNEDQLLNPTPELVHERREVGGRICSRPGLPCCLSSRVGRPTGKLSWGLPSLRLKMHGIVKEKDPLEREKMGFRLPWLPVSILFLGAKPVQSVDEIHRVSQKGASIFHGANPRGPLKACKQHPSSSRAASPGRCKNPA